MSWKNLILSGDLVNCQTKNKKLQEFWSVSDHFGTSCIKGLHAKAIMPREKDFGCGKFLWKDTRKESSMFWLRNWSYLITSSSSTTLLLDILIFHSYAWQCLFCFLIGCIHKLHWLIILWNNFFSFRVEFFSTQKRIKNF